VNAETAPPSSVDITDYVAVVRRHWKLVAACGVGLMVLALAYSFTRPTVYVSKAQIALPESQSGLPQQSTIDTFTELEVLKSESVAILAAKDLRTDRSIANLRTHLSATAPTEGRVLQVSFSDSSAKAAQKGAAAFTNAYIDYRTGSVQEDKEQRSDSIAAQITGVDEATATLTKQLEDVDPDSERAKAIERQIDRLNGQRGQYVINQAEIDAESIPTAQVITPAILPSGPQRSGIVKNGLLGLMAGLVIGVGLAFVRDRFDEQVRESADVRGFTGVPSLGAIPVLPESMRYAPFSLVAVHAPETPQADAFRRLRTSVTIAADEANAKVIAVTSSVAGEGKSTVAANLAVTLEQSGRRVLLISADLRRPAVENMLEVPTKPGLVEVLSREVPLEETLHSVGRLTVLPAGRHHNSATDLLQAPTMRTILEQARTSYDVTVIDTPPVLAVADVLGLASMVDGLILVVAVAETSEAQVADAADQLRASGGTLLGVVLNRSGGTAPQYYDQYRRPDTTL
jgi:capsular exopolysaccharide synthesis family protein